MKLEIARYWAVVAIRRFLYLVMTLHVSFLINLHENESSDNLGGTARHEM